MHVLCMWMGRTLRIVFLRNRRQLLRSYTEAVEISPRDLNGEEKEGWHLKCISGGAM